MMKVFSHALDEQSYLGLQMAGYDIHVHQSVAHDLVMVQLVYALLVIHTAQIVGESLNVKVFQ